MVSHGSTNRKVAGYNQADACQKASRFKKLKRDWTNSGKVPAVKDSLSILWAFNAPSTSTAVDNLDADIRHAVSRAMALGGWPRGEAIAAYLVTGRSLAALLSVLVGRYPDPSEVTIDYAEWVRRSLDTFEFSLAQDPEVPTNVVGSLTPLSLSSYGITARSMRLISRWFGPGIVFGDALDFNDLVLLLEFSGLGAQARDPEEVPAKEATDSV